MDSPSLQADLQQLCFQPHVFFWLFLVFTEDIKLNKQKLQFRMSSFGAPEGNISRAIIWMASLMSRSDCSGGLNLIDGID